MIIHTQVNDIRNPELILEPYRKSYKVPSKTCDVCKLIVLKLAARIKHWFCIKINSLELSFEHRLIYKSLIPTLAKTKKIKKAAVTSIGKTSEYYMHSYLRREVLAVLMVEAFAIMSVFMIVLCNVRKNHECLISFYTVLAFSEKLKEKS